MFSGFYDDGVPACKCRTQFPCCHCQGKVPGDYLPADTQRFTHCVSEFSRRGIDDLAMDLICVAAIVPQTAADFSEVFVKSNSVGFAIIPGFDRGKCFGVGVD